MNPRGFTNLQRFEFKYHVPMAWLDSIASFLSPWCDLDPYCQSNPDGFYWITSLYLDSHRQTFFKRALSKPDGRFNMRIRSYGAPPPQDGPFHFEVKEKRRDTVSKSRGIIKNGAASLLWNDTAAVLLRSPNEEERQNLERFLRLSLAYNAEPTVLTQYRRMAWFGLSEVYARVTLDIDMRWREATGFDMSATPAQMRPSGLPEYRDPGSDAILELKCDPSHVPDWMMELVLMLNLNRSGYSKFATATNEMIRRPGIRIPLD